MTKHEYICRDGDCPQGIEVLREICLSSSEKKAIFLALRERIAESAKPEISVGQMERV